MRKNNDVKKLVLTSILLAIIVILQLFASVVKFGTFQISLVLIPITIGAILLGPKVGALLGFSFGMIVLLTGDAAFFIAYGGLISTVFVVLLKGTLAGFLSGLVYKTLNRNEENIKPILLSSFTTPLVNTGVFALGTLLLLSPALKEAAGGSNSFVYLFTVMIGTNFIIELIITIILVTAIHRICLIYNNMYNENSK